MFETMAAITDTGWGKVAQQRKGKIQGIHTLVWTLFSDHPDRDRDFIYVLEESKEGRNKIFIRSQREPQENPCFSFETSREIKTGFKKGDRFLFQCDFNPTKTKNSKPVDIVLDERFQDTQRSPTELAWEWWQKREDMKGFKIHDLRVDYHRQYDMPREGRNLSIMRVIGDIEVVDPKKFQQFFEKGIGKQKAKGCGLILLGGHK